MDSTVRFHTQAIEGRSKSHGGLVWGIYALFLILAVALFHKGYNSTDLVIKKHWLGQGIGILGLGWLVVLIPLIKVFKCEHAPPAGRGEAPRP